MKRIGLTGGIGSGKSTLAAMLGKTGVPLLDLDALGRELHNDTDCRAELLASFGEGILDADGRVDRAALGRICFSSAAKTALLNSIMHPRIWRKEQQWLAGQQAPYALIEASVLIESGGVARMDAVVVVLAELATRRNRVVASRGMDIERFDAIVARQCDDEARRNVADFIIENNAGFDALQQSADVLHRQLIALKES